MGNSYFQFKKFTVFHNCCTFKVGVDGVLLGAWADVEGITNVLDVGTGSGLIALMIAQRNCTAKIKAIDIDNNSVLQAQENFRNSQFSNRISIKKIDFRKFLSKREKFDLVICNPPFFVNSLQSPENKRNIARHSVCLTHEELLTNAKNLLTEEGKISIILPLAEGEKAKNFAQKIGLALSRCTKVFPKENMPAKRILLEFILNKNNENQTLTEDFLLLETKQRGIYTKEYTELVKDFYLKM
ncbi:MAG: methyltransferase [Paludibacter sp.]|nr:methyltransferase [Paludibacter sp.]